LGIISNSFPSAERILCRLNLTHRFSYIVLSHQVHAAKPERRTRLTALYPSVHPQVLLADNHEPMVRGAEIMGEGRKNLVRLYSIFLASPQDVRRERERFCEVVELVNGLLFQLNKPARLEVRRWERDVPPDLEIPEKLILKHIPMEECDIFVAIFWTRFGSPPGTFRPDGTPYLAGTEQEIEEAIKVRKQSDKNRPVIMILLKTDPIPPDTPRDQRHRLEEYLRKFEVGGEHTALIGTFKTRKSARRISEEFEFKVMTYLMSTVEEFLAQDQYFDGGTQ